MSDRESVNIEDRLARAATFMSAHRLQGVYIEGALKDKRQYEGISFMDSEGREVAEVRFVEGEALVIGTEEVERRLRIPGLITEVIKPVQRAAAGIYEEGYDLLDERFDTLPGLGE